MRWQQQDSGQETSPISRDKRRSVDRAIAAILVGGTSLFGGIGSLSGTFIGAITLTLVLYGMNLLTINSNWQPLVTGAIVILAAWVDIATRRRAEARA